MMQQIDSKLGETALHEAAHAVVAVKVSTNGRGLTENGVVTIEPDEFGAGHVSCWGQMSAEQYILGTLAGGMAEARLINIAHKHLGQPSINLMMVKHWTSGDAQIIAHFLNLLHPSRQMAALEWWVFESNFRLGMPVPATVAASRSAYLVLSEAEKKDVKLLADSFVCALITLCAWGDSTTARQVISLNTAIPYVPRMALLGAPWFKTLSDSTDKVRDLLDEHGGVVCALADRLLEVRTMTGAEAEKFISYASSRNTNSGGENPSSGAEGPHKLQLHGENS